MWDVKGYEHCYREKYCTLPGTDTPSLILDWGGKVIAKQQSDDLSQLQEFPIEENIPITGDCSLMQLRNIAGKAYVTAHWRSVFRREEPN
jgi:hypothetical protein